MSTCGDCPLPPYRWRSKKQSLRKMPVENSLVGKAEVIVANISEFGRLMRIERQRRCFCALVAEIAMAKLESTMAAGSKCWRGIRMNLCRQNRSESSL